MRSFAFLIGLFLLFAIGLGMATDLPAESGGRLLVGWLFFLGHASSRITVNWSGVATLAVCGALLLFGGHRFAVWLSSAMAVQAPSAKGPPDNGEQSQVAASRRWQLRRTALLLAIVVLMFVAGISFIGLVHQTAWLATTPEPMSEYRLNLQHTRRYHKNNLRWVGGAFSNWTDVYKRPPMNGRWPEAKQDGSHSWQTRIAGFLPVLTDNIDFKLDWDHPKNTPAFRRFVPAYLTPDFGVLRESRGFAVSHYAGNVSFFEPQPPSMATLEKSGRQLIVCGEAAGNFRAWGDPANLRDLTRGLNCSPDGFGNADETGANFLMADGSTRFLSTNVDPRVLSALASPVPEAP